MRTLADMLPGDTATVKEITTEGDMRRRLLDIGLTPGKRVECIGIFNSRCGNCNSQ